MMAVIVTMMMDTDSWVAVVFEDIRGDNDDEDSNDDDNDDGDDEEEDDDGDDDDDDCDA